MRLTYPYQTERIGAVRIYGVQHVFELDSGLAPGGTESALSWGTTVSHVPWPALRAIHARLAVVVPIMDERLKLLEGVLAGIPHDCLVIVVSNSSRDPVDRFGMERDTIERFCRFNHRSAVVVHQGDAGLAQAFVAAGMGELVDETGRVPSGKGEGMIIGIALARLAGREYVGFVDADNYVPGSVREYVDAYAADFHLARTRFAMVRISWHSKPKVVDGEIFFNRWGRTSEVTNRFLNLLLAHLTGFGTEALRTGNAGEHAMTMELALRVRLAGGYAIEPFELLELFERFGGVLPPETRRDSEVMREGVEVYQVETRNPHFHEQKGEAHVEEMRRVALASIYHSPVAPARLREEILGYVARGEEVLEEERPVPYPPLIDLDWPVFASTLSEQAMTFERLLTSEGQWPSGEPTLPLPLEMPGAPAPWTLWVAPPGAVRTTPTRE